MEERRMTWNEIVEAYPDKWVVVKDAEMEGPDVISGIVVEVLSDDEIGNYRIENCDKEYEYRRTTEGYFNGITGSSIIISVN